MCLPEENATWLAIAAWYDYCFHTYSGLQQKKLFIKCERNVQLHLGLFLNAVGSYIVIKNLQSLYWDRIFIWREGHNEGLRNRCGKELERWIDCHQNEWKSATGRYEDVGGISRKRQIRDKGLMEVKVFVIPYEEQQYQPTRPLRAPRN